jgi:DNA-binding transcriptional LysR family regulator
MAWACANFLISMFLMRCELAASFRSQDHAAPVEPIWAVYPSRRHLSPKVTQFVRLLKTKLPGLLAG